MARMARDEATERIRAVLRPAVTVCAGVALGLLACAVALAWWSRLGAPRPFGLDAWFIGGLHHWGADLPSRIPLAVTVVALLLIAAMVTVRQRGRDGRDLPGIPVVLVVLAVLAFFAYFSQGIPAFYRTLTEAYPVTPALSAGVAAWLLCLAGAIATLLATAAFARLSRDSVRLVVVGVVIALIAGVGVTVGALRAGDDNRFVDGSTAAATDVPALPSELGRRGFGVTVPDVFDAEAPGMIGGKPGHYQIAAAGAGFVVYANHRVTAYGTDGTERWHYARTGQSDVGTDGISVYDNGATVVVSLGRALVALDAVTGARLWTSTDAQMLEAVGHSADRDVPFLVYRDTVSWTRFDTRTGKPAWTVADPNPASCVDREIDADTRSWVVSVARCSSSDGIDVRLVALDPATGATQWETTVLHAAPPPPEQQGTPVDVIAAAATAVGVFLQFDGAGAPTAPSYANVTQKTVTALPERGYPQPSPGPGDEFVVSDRQLTLFGADGAQRCTVSTTVSGLNNRVPGRGGGLSYLVFPQSFVVADRGIQPALRTFDTTTCAESGSVSATAVEGMVPVPGAVLVLRRDGQNLLIDGYRAG
jgi:hypothetical protein